MHVLYAVDLEGEGVEREVALAGAWALRLGAALDLLHIDTYDSGGPHRRPDGEILARLDALERVVPPPARGRTKLAHAAEPAEAIVALASSSQLVIVGTHRRRGWERLFQGSIAEAVIRSSHAPVLVVRSTDGDTLPARVLVAVDAFDEGAVDLARTAADWALRLGAALELVHVVPASLVAEPSHLPSPASWTNAVAGLVGEANHRLRHLAGTLPAEARATCRVELGDPPVALAETSGGDAMLVLRTHNRHGVGRLLWGSVSEHVTRLASGPVLVLPSHIER